MKRILYLLLFGALFMTASPVLAKEKPLALVWTGPGACKPTCVDAAKIIARRSGFRIQSVRPGFIDYALFKKAKLWVQPGGKSTTAAAAMGPELMQQVRDFVYQGGGYVGFCAGAFISTAEIGTSHKIGYGIAPGRTELLIKDGNDHGMLPMTTPLGKINMYYAGGPFLEVSDADLKASNGEVIARYADGKVAGIRAHYGKGKLAVIGTHPEAGFIWKLTHGFVDLKGTRFFSDYMVHYATSP
jgi:glutamine amidotransferase-like uncharacterized protein